LFERRGQRFVATPLAHELARAASAMESGATAVLRVLAERRAEQTRSVRISASRMTATHLLPSAIAELMARGERVNVELSAEDQLSNLAEREADLAIRHVKPAQQSLIARRLGQIRFGFYAARPYLRRYAEPRAMSDLAAHNLVGLDRSQLMMRGAKRLGLALERSAFAFRSDDRVVHWAAVRAGVGIGVLPTYLGDREELVRVLPDEKLTPSAAWLVARRDVLERTEVRRSFDLLRERLSALLA
jgi:DNA-binding transcriptional LysR family regulator